MTDSDPFTPLLDSNDAGGVDIGGQTEAPENIGRSLLKAADRLAETWRTSDWRDDDLALPILQTYRHAIELLLKWPLTKSTTTSPSANTWAWVSRPCRTTSPRG